MHHCTLYTNRLTASQTDTAVYSVGAFIFIYCCAIDRWDPSKRMNPDEAYRHEWFTGGSSPVTATAPCQEQSPLSSTSNASKCVDDSDGIFSASSSTSSAGSAGPTTNQQQQQQQVGTSNGAEKLTKYQVYKGKKPQPQQGTRAGGAALTDQTKETSQRDCERGNAAATNNKRTIDADPNNFDDSGTYLPTIL